MSFIRERERTYDDLHAVLVAAQGERSRRREVRPGDTEPGWVLHERDVMHDRVNALRARMHRDPVSSDAIRLAEQSACGHSDYTHKFALRCAFLVEGDAR